MAPLTNTSQTQRQRRTEQRHASETGGAQPKPATNVLSVPNPDEPDEALPYHVELWDLSRQSVERVLGDALSAPLAQAIFHSALREYPNRHITLRYGSRIIARSDARRAPQVE